FDVPFLGSIAVLYAVALVYISANLTVGITLSSIAQNQLQAMQLTFFYFLPSILLSGFMFPFEGMPRWAQAIGSVLPATYFMRSVRGILLKGNDWIALWPHVWPMLVFTAIVMTIALVFYKKTLDCSPTLARASAKLREADERRGARVGETRLPRVDAKLSANRVDVQPEAVGAQALPVSTPLNLYLASAALSYHFDLFGATRSELEGLRAQVDAERFELEAARLMLAGNVVTAAIREASLREQIAIAGEI